jgi:hypothetical protein
MRKPIRTDEGAVELPEERRRGSYPPDVARRRRQLGLPVTPEEHAAYARGETREPPVTRAQMEATLRDVLNRLPPVGRPPGHPGHARPVDRIPDRAHAHA